MLWTSWAQDGDANSVQGQRYDSDGMAIGTDFRINSYTTGNQAQADVAFAKGQWVTVWSSYRQDGSAYAIEGRRLAANGVAIGEELQVNTLTSSYRRLPATADLGRGEFVVVWQSRPDGPNYDIKGQRFVSPIFSDGFESGDLSVWTSSIP